MHMCKIHLLHCGMHGTGIGILAKCLRNNCDVTQASVTLLNELHTVKYDENIFDTAHG